MAIFSTVAAMMSTNTAPDEDKAKTDDKLAKAKSAAQDADAKCDTLPTSQTPDDTPPRA